MEKIIRGGIFKMKKLGRIVSKQKKRLVLKTDELVKIGARIFDEKGILIGHAIDYFGPVDKPYIIIKPTRDAEHLIGKEVYG